MSHSWSTLNPNHTQSTLPNRAWTKTSPTQKPQAKSSRWCPRGTLPTPKEIQYILVYLLCSKYGFFLTKSDSLRKPVNINKTQPLCLSGTRCTTSTAFSPFPPFPNESISLLNQIPERHQIPHFGLPFSLISYYWYLIA
jgi:hypothetical protein